MDRTAPSDAGTPPAAPPRSPLPAVAAGLMLAAGILHLLLVDEHLAHARGAGLFFLAVGTAQVVWAVLYLRHPGGRLARAGLAALVVAPTVLYVVTRLWRAPWSAGPEAVDVVGLATQAVQLSAGATLWPWRPSAPSVSVRRASAALGVGLLLAGGAYGGALAAEEVDWLSGAEAAHLHLPGADHGHDDHGGDLSGTRGVNMVGTETYDGPPTGAAIAGECEAAGEAGEECWVGHLTDLLVAEGSVAAFDRLVELMAADAGADANSHAIAHRLGHAAYQAYGLDIALTLGECSYEVFQGCIHGALQAYFDDLSRQGKELNEETLGSVCSAASSSFEAYTCHHGVGHGVMIHTGYDLHGSLDTCALLEGWSPQRSCYGGVYMENVVGYLDSLKPGHVPHDHGNGPPTYWVDRDDPAYPCNVVADPYEGSCWRMQTSLILRFNGGDFEAASRVCDDAGEHHLACYASLGRDAPPYANRDPERMSRMCSHGDWDEQVACMKAVTAGVILKANTPQAGLDLCPRLPDPYQPLCYRETGNQADSMLPEAEAAAVCGRAPTQESVAACHEGRLA